MKKYECKRGHGAFFLTVKNDKDFCEYILGYKMVGDGGTNVLYCGDLPINQEVPKGFQKIAK